MSLPTPSKPSNAGAYKLSAGDFEVTLPTTINSADEPIAGTVYFEEIAGRDGLFSTRVPNFGGRTLSLSGMIQDEDTVTTLRRVLNYKRVTVEREERVIEMDVTNISIVEEVLGSVWRVAIDFEAPVFYWRSKELVTAQNPGVILYTGTLNTFPIITVTVPAGGIYEAGFTINGRTAKLCVSSSCDNSSGTIGNEDEVLVIDCENLTAVIGNTSHTGYMNDEFFIDPPRFDPDTNIIDADINGNSFTPVQLEWSDNEPIIYNGQEVYYYPYESAFEVKYYERYL